MEECESLDSEMRELQGFQSETSDTNSQDDEDEVEELQNSLREVVQDPSVKPKLQCLMVDPSFSMVTVQSEDSGIVWETASSRCSTPWASETSSTSEGYSMDGSGAAGKITIVFDEEKIVRRRTRSGGRSSRLGDRLSRPGSSRSASVLGKERPEMAEVSLPNIKPKQNKTDPDLEEIKNKDQQLFSLISEGYEILNIRVPSKLPTVDEEENAELQDNLSYLNLSPKIKSRNHFDWTQPQDHVLTEETHDHQEPSKQEEETESAPTPTPKDTTGDIDYFEKFTLLDEVVPVEQAPEQQEEAEEPAGKPGEEEQKPANDTATDNPSASEESFVFVTDVDIVEEHLDEVFYGEGPPTDALHHHREEDEARRRRRESQRSRIASGSVLFGAEQTTLTPIYISPGPPKIIDPILLEEPTAMSFMYSDLYEDAMGERKRSDEEHSGAESVASERFYKRRSSDEAPDGYLEKFTLKDETPTVDIQSDPVQEKRGGRMMWSQSKFELTGCLIRVDKDDEKEKTEEAKMQEGSVGDRSEELPSAVLEDKIETVAETEKEILQVPAVVVEKAVRASEDITEECKPTEERLEDQQVKVEVKSDQTEPPEDNTEKLEVHQEECTVEDRKEQEDLQEEKKETVAETEKAAGILQASAVIGNQAIKEASGVESRQMEKMEDQQVTVETDQTKPPDSEKPEAHEENCEVEKRKGRVEHQKEKEIISEQSNVDAEQHCKSEKEAHVLIEALDQTTVSTEFPPVVTKSETQTLLNERTSTEEASPDDKMVVDEEQLPTETKEDASAEVKEPEREQQETLTLTEPPAEVEASPHTSSPCRGKEAVEVIAEDVAPVEVVMDSDSTVHTIVEVTEKAMGETEIQTQVQIDLQEVMSTEEIDVQKELPDREQVHESLSQETTAEKLPTSINEDVITLQDMEVKTETSSEITECVMPEVVKVKSEEKQQEIVETEQLQPEMTENESDQAILITEDTSKQPTEDDGFSVQDIVNVGDELIVFVPKGQAIEMDVEISQWLEEAAEDTPTEPENRPEVQASIEEAKPEPQGEVEPDVSIMEDLALIDSDSVCQQQEPVEEPITEKQELGQDSSEDTVVISPMRSFSPLEDLSELRTEAPEMPLDELEYEVITEQDAKEIQEAEAQRDAEEPKPELVLKQDEGVDIGKEEMVEAFLEEELIEAGYEIIDAEEENQARLAAELQGMEWFCVTCGCLLSEQDRRSAEHHHHKVETVDKAYEEIKETLSDWISELQGRSENIEDLVSELELAYNSVEDQCVESEAAMQAQNEEMMALVMEQYNNMSISMEEEKKAKLEQLYDQIVSFQESIDSAKATLETTSREAETDARSPEDIQERLKAALDSALSLELGPKGLLVFEDYAKANTSSSNLTQRKGIPVPQRPTLQPQEPGSASSTSVTVYWNVNPGDIIDCFQVYCMEDPHGAISEEYRVTVKESYCVLEELDPDKVYKVWVMAVNYTGCSLPSDRLVFKTAPSVPAIDTERCTVLWDSATLRWSSPQQTAGQSYTLEYCRQYELEGEGLRSIAGIKVCEQKVLLQPNENYLFYIKAVNEAGVSEQSEAALISTKGTRFHLLKASAHPGLELSEDHTAVHYSQDARKAAAASDKQCPSILGDLLPARGLYYWETTVSGCAAYRLGVAYSTVNRNSSLGEDCLTWCLQCIPSPSGCRYQLLHNDVQSSVFVTEMPERVGVLLDYQLGRLSFYNAQGGQLLGSFTQSFTQPCHPALGLELPGSLGVSMVLEVPEFTRNS